MTTPIEPTDTPAAEDIEGGDDTGSADVEGHFARPRLVGDDSTSGADGEDVEGHFHPRRLVGDDSTSGDGEDVEGHIRAR